MKVKLKKKRSQWNKKLKYRNIRGRNVIYTTNLIRQRTIEVSLRVIVFYYTLPVSKEEGSICKK